MKNLKITMRNALYLVLIVVIFIGCDSGTGVKQEYMDNYLITKAKYKHEDVWIEYDIISLNTNDSIKCIRYREAEEWINKFKTIDDSNCH